MFYITTSQEPNSKQQLHMSLKRLKQVNSSKPEPTKEQMQTDRAITKVVKKRAGPAAKLGASPELPIHKIFRQQRIYNSVRSTCQQSGQFCVILSQRTLLEVSNK